MADNNWLSSSMDGDGGATSTNAASSNSPPPVGAVVGGTGEEDGGVGVEGAGVVVVVGGDQSSTCTAASSSQGSLLSASSYRQWTIPAMVPPQQSEQPLQNTTTTQSSAISSTFLSADQQFSSFGWRPSSTTSTDATSPQPPSALKSTQQHNRKRQRNSSSSSSNNFRNLMAGFPAFPVIPNPQITTSESFGNNHHHHHSNNTGGGTSSCNTSTSSKNQQPYYFNTHDLTPPSWIMSRHPKNHRHHNKNHSSYSHSYPGRHLPVPPPLWWLQHDQPDTTHFAQLLGSLILTTALAVLAGYDAKQHCILHETNAILELVVDDDAAAAAGEADDAADDVVYDEDDAYIDDTVAAYEAAYDEAILIETDGCIKMFRNILLPNLVVTATLGSLGLYLLRQPQKTPREAFTWTLRLLIILLLIMVIQTYTVTSIMLMPRNPDNVSATENPYQSLGAVDLLGHVGDNANLYYLAWVSEGLCLALVYQTATATVRARRAVRTQQSQSKASPLLPATSWSSIVSSGNSSSVGLGGCSGGMTSFLGSSSNGGATGPAAATTTGAPGSTGIMKTTPTFDSAQQDKEHYESRNTWYQSLYKLRIRTGIWTAALISCLVVVASAQYVWRQVLWPYVKIDTSSYNTDDAAAAAVDDAYNMDDDEQEQQYYEQASSSVAVEAGAAAWDFGFAVCQTIAINSATLSSGSGTAIPAQMCRRTIMAWLAGVLACLLSTFSIGMHLVARTYAHHCGDEVDDAGAAVAAATMKLHVDPNNTSIMTIVEQHDEQLHNDTYHLHYRTTLFRRLLERHRIPLGIELVLSIILSLLLGCNAVLTTGVQGPAANVGNLYYASWLAFLLLIRICLGCIEEWYEVEKRDDSILGGDNTDSFSSYSMNKKPSRPTTTTISLVPSSGQTSVTEDGYTAASDDGDMQNHRVPVENKPSQDTDARSVQSMTDPFEKDRVNRLRSYFFLGIFSAVCCASSYDAGANQEGHLSRAQKYFILSPLIVACQSLILFILCLSKRCYLVASHFCVGGILSVVSFVFWLADLVLTMHSEDSWAVNAIGEIEMANLYYFSWAGIITAGLQFMSYVHALFGISKGEDYMTFVWVAIVKVCFVILGAGLHIWHTISDQCDLNLVISDGAVTFCSRTILAMIIALTGMLVGGLVVLVRMMMVVCPACRCTRVQAHVEMLLSSFLVFLFGAAVALITGIGGPGQSVGDLYYSTWLAFWVSLGIFVSCYDQINLEEDEIEHDAEDECNNSDTSGNDQQDDYRQVDETSSTAINGGKQYEHSSSFKLSLHGAAAAAAMGESVLV